MSGMDGARDDEVGPGGETKFRRIPGPPRCNVVGDCIAPAVGCFSGRGSPGHEVYACAAHAPKCGCGAQAFLGWQGKWYCVAHKPAEYTPGTIPMEDAGVKG